MVCMVECVYALSANFFFFASRRRHTRFDCDWSSDVCSSDLADARAFLLLAVQGVPARQPDVREEKKGPRVGAPEGAIKGFLKAAGLGAIEQDRKSVV